MRNSISCEIQPPPPVPHIIAAVSRNSLNALSFAGGDPHRSYFSFSSHHHHKDSSRPSPFKHNASSYHIYDEYPRYSLPIRHEKKQRNSIQDLTARSRHQHIRKNKQRQRETQKTPPPRLMSVNESKSRIKKRKSNHFEIEYEYDTDEYNEGGRISERKCYHHISPHKLNKRKNKKIMNKNEISSHILMNNMMEIQHEMISHFERLRDGDLNETNPFETEKTSVNKKKNIIHLNIKHDRIASFASSMNHHLEHYHEEEDLEIFNIEPITTKRRYNDDDDEDKLDLDDDDDESISPIKSEIETPKRKRKIKTKTKSTKQFHEKSRSKSMSSIMNGVRTCSELLKYSLTSPARYCNVENDDEYDIDGDDAAERHLKRKIKSKKKRKCRKKEKKERKHKKHKNKKKKKTLKEKIKHLQIDLNADFINSNDDKKRKKTMRKWKQNMVLPISQISHDSNYFVNTNNEHIIIPIPPKPKKISHKIDVI